MQSVEKKVVYGVNLEKLEAFRETLRKNPPRLGLRAKAYWEGVMGRSLVHIGPYRLGDQEIDRPTRHYTIAYGAWKEVEETVGAVGPSDRMEPVEMALGAIASCLCVAISYNAPREGIKLDGLEVTVQTDVDPSVLFALKGPEAHPSCMPNLHCEIKAKGDLSEEDLEKIGQLAKHSPVYGMVANANNIASRVVKDS